MREGDDLLTGVQNEADPEQKAIRSSNRYPVWIKHTKRQSLVTGGKGSRGRQTLLKIRIGTEKTANQVAKKEEKNVPTSESW